MPWQHTAALALACCTVLPAVQSCPLYSLVDKRSAAPKLLWGLTLTAYLGPGPSLQILWVTAGLLLPPLHAADMLTAAAEALRRAAVGSMTRGSPAQPGGPLLGLVVGRAAADITQGAALPRCRLWSECLGSHAECTGCGSHGG